MKHKYLLVGLLGLLALASCDEDTKKLSSTEISELPIDTSTLPFEESNNESSSIPSTDVVTKFTIYFKNYDGSILYTNEYKVGELPSYDGTPTKPSDDTYIYTFSGWDKEIKAVDSSTTYTATYTSELINKKENLGVKTIAEVTSLCSSVTDLNESKIGIDETKLVTIKAKAISKISLVKTTKKFGLDKSSPYKVMVGDETGMIAVATSFSNDGTTFWGKVADYAGKDTSSYEITGYLSMYLGVPELYVTDYKYDSSLNVKTDYSSYSKETLTLEQYYEKASASSYNCAGHGYGDVVTLKNMYCFSNRDKMYFLTDGKNVIKVNKGLSSVSVGATYDITGYISLSNWTPSMYLLTSKISETSTTLSCDNAISTTIVDFKKNKCSKDDTNSRLDSYIKSFKNIYTSTVYMDAYVENGKYYVTMGDTYINTENFSSNHLVNHIVYKEIAISNENYWNVSEDEITKFNPHAEYIGSDTDTIKVNYIQYIQEWGSYSTSKDQPIWKVILV